MAKKVSKKARNMKTQLTRPFKGRDPTSVLYFLETFKMAWDHNDVHEGMEIWLFQFFLGGAAHEAVTSRISYDSGGVRRRHADV